MITTPLAAGGTIEVGHHVQATVFGLTFNLDTIWSTVLAGLIVVVFGLIVARRTTSGVPSKPQVLWETVVGQIEGQVEENMGVKTQPFVVPLAVAIFFFILIANWIELVPTQWNEGVHVLPSPSADVNLTYALGLFVIVLLHIFAIRQKGFGKWIKGIVVGHNALLAPLNILEELVKPFTLALRLFGNILAGGIMISIIGLLPWYVAWGPNIVWKLFDMFIGALQAVIFALLTILYFSFQLAPEEEGH
jgi:F-type H+-transporting ATPase subunit a